MEKNQKRLTGAWDNLDLEVVDKMMSWDPIYEEQVQSLVGALEPCKLVGDLCTGFGYTAKALVEQGKIVHGIDVSLEALEYAKAKVGQIGKRKFFPVLANMYNLPYDNTFDGISCLSNLGACSNIEGLVSEVKRALKPCGLFAFTGQEPEQAKAYEKYITEKFKERETLVFTEQQAERLKQIIHDWNVKPANGGPSKIDLATTRSSSKYILNPLQNAGMEILYHNPICANMLYLIVARK